MKTTLSILFVILVLFIGAAIGWEFDKGYRIKVYRPEDAYRFCKGDTIVIESSITNLGLVSAIVVKNDYEHKLLYCTRANAYDPTEDLTSEPQIVLYDQLP